MTTSRPHTSNHKSMVLPHSVWLLLLLSGIGLCSERPAVLVEHVATIPCEDLATGLSFTPLGLGFGLMDELYVIDSEHSRIYTAPRSLQGLSVFSECLTDFPGCDFVDLAGDGAGGIYVSERAAGCVLSLDRWGELESYVEVGMGIAGIGRGKAGLVYAAMTVDGSIQILDFSTQAEAVESPVSGPDENAYPVDCHVLEDGTVLVSDSFAKQVLLVGPLGDLKGALRGFQFKSPFGVTSTANGLILVADSELGVVAVFSIEGDFVCTLGKGIMKTPTFLDSGGRGLICVSDPGNLAIEVFRIETADGE